MKIKTIDIRALEWFDRINGNSYFAGDITINYAQKNAIKLKMPFQYGYGDSYLTNALDLLIKAGYITTKEKHPALWRYCKDNNIILRHFKHENCLKRELKAI